VVLTGISPSSCRVSGTTTVFRAWRCAARPSPGRLARIIHRLVCGTPLLAPSTPSHAPASSTDRKSACGGRPAIWRRIRPGIGARHPALVNHAGYCTGLRDRPPKARLRRPARSLAPNSPGDRGTPSCFGESCGLDAPTGEHSEVPGAAVRYRGGQAPTPVQNCERNAQIAEPEKGGGSWAPSKGHQSTG
jgi:hypothetical protein